MGQAGSGVVARTEDRPRERFDDPSRGDASWFTLFSADMTPTETMSAGVMEMVPGGIGLKPHRHEPPEIYHVVCGTGVLTIDGVETAVGPGSTAFIPGDAEHGIRNVGADTLRVFYVFPTDRFADVIYRFRADPPGS